MCGEIEDEAASGREAWLRFMHEVGHIREHRGPEPRVPQPGQPLAGRHLHDYMSRLFADMAGASADDGLQVTDAGADLLRAQAIVLARLCGLMASCLPAADDPLRPVMEAVLDGYSAKDGAHDHHHHDHG